MHYEQFQDGAVKCIEDEIPFEIPTTWQWSRINSLSFYIFAGGDRPSTYSKNKTEKNMIPIYSNAIENNGLYGYTDKARVFIPSITVSGRGTIGFCCVRREPFVPIIRLLTITPSPLIMLDFLNYVFMKLLELGTGSSIPQLTVPMISAKLIPVAPENEQRRIVYIVSDALSKIDEINETEDKLKDSILNLKSHILDLAIRGKLVPQDHNDEPASALLKRIRAEKEELIKQGKIKRDKKESVIFKGDDNSYYRKINTKIEELNLGYEYQLPDGWSFATVGEYTTKVTEQVASGSFAALRENVVSLKTPDYAIMVKTADFSNNFTKNLTYTNKRGYEFLENSNLFGGELILSNIGSIGKVFIVPNLNYRMTLAPNSIMIRFNCEEYRDYLYYLFSSPLGYNALMSISSGAAVAKFNKTDLKNLAIPIPPLAEQKRIVEAIETIFIQDQL